jgi:hypothetical protein
MTTNERRNDEWSERLSEFIDRELSPGDMMALARHLELCDSCRTAAVELAGVRDRLATRTTVPLPEMWSEIVPHLESQDSHRRGRLDTRPSSVHQVRRRALVGGLAAATILVTLVGGAWIGSALSRNGIALFGWAIPGLPMPRGAPRSGRQDAAVADPAARAVLWKLVDDIDHSLSVMNRRAASDSGNSILLDSIARLRDERAALRRLLTGAPAGPDGRIYPESTRKR